MIMQPQSWRCMTIFAASVIILLFSTATVLYNVSTRVFETEKSTNDQPYTFIDNDFPELLPLDLPNVLLTTEESRHYGISGLDDREEWASSAAYGFGYLRLGEEKRRFALSMWHQLHCLRTIRMAMEGHHDAGMRGHMQHCLTYLRQMILCAPHLTLEPADMLTRNYEIKRVGATHVCKDWSKVYEEMERNVNATTSRNSERPSTAEVED